MNYRAHLAQTHQRLVRLREKIDADYADYQNQKVQSPYGDGAPTTRRRNKNTQAAKAAKNGLGIRVDPL